MVQEVVRTLALRLKLRNTSGTPVHHVALLKRILDRQGVPTRMIKGYCVIEETKEACEHYWLRTDDGLDLDVAFAVACLRTPELMALQPALLETLPPGLTRSDWAESKIRDENQRLFDLYEEDPRAFWNEAPRDVSSFQLKVS